jgi:ABC-type branched-subunit amino acid transport system permease subunit
VRCWSYFNAINSGLGVRRFYHEQSFWLALPIAMIGMMLLTLANGWHIEKSQWYFFAIVSITFSAFCV